MSKPNLDGLDERHAAVYRFIVSSIEKNGDRPTQEEIKAKFGYKSLGSVSYVLERLAEQHLIVVAKKHGGYRLVGVTFRAVYSGRAATIQEELVSAAQELVPEIAEQQ